MKLTNFLMSFKLGMKGLSLNRLILSQSMTMLGKSSSSPPVDYVFFPSSGFKDNYLKLGNLYPFAIIRPLDSNELWSQSSHDAIWCSYRNEIQLNCKYINLQDAVNKEPVPTNKSCKTNSCTSDMHQILSSTNVDSSSIIYSRELLSALTAVKRTSFIARSYQIKYVLDAKGKGKGKGESIIKDDSSPVTVVDFAVQALILDKLHSEFPDDTFIAEEDSGFLRGNAPARSAVLEIIQTATGDIWSEDRLFRAIDLGCSHDGSPGNGRVWVLDPIDGTKGFIRGENFCIALALLINGETKLSLLGCPNMNVVSFPLKDKSTTSNELDRSPPALSVDAVSRPLDLVVENSSGDMGSLKFVPPHIGGIFFAVSGVGAFFSTLSGCSPSKLVVSPNDSLTNWNINNSDLLHRYIPAHVQPPASREMISGCRFSESAESSHGNGVLSAAVLRHLGIRQGSMRLDGQCKHAAVGIGAVQCSMRLPPQGYIEKIWDHAPGAHFVNTAGGVVTDQDGKQLDFKADPDPDPDGSAGNSSSGTEVVGNKRSGVRRLMSANVRAIVTSCGGSFHQDVLDAIHSYHPNGDGDRREI